MPFENKYLCHRKQLFREQFNSLPDLWCIVDVRRKLIIDLQLHLCNIELFFKICEESNGCLMSATDGYRM